jgi:predicted aldo/keto reductase-like oxidoreductase
MKKLILKLYMVFLIGNFGTAQLMAQLPKINSTINETEINKALKEALNNGINKQVSKLASKDGFLKNEVVKIMLPPELKIVDKKLRQIGMGKLADEGIALLNRAAEDAVKEATPIFVDALKQLRFSDAKNILMGNNSSATTYLQNTTTTSLYDKFNPVIKNSLSKVGADKIWHEIIKKYNTIPFIKKINPDITDYTTNKAMEGVFKMIAIEEKEIRTNLGARNSSLLKRVFGLQDSN